MRKLIIGCALAASALTVAAPAAAQYYPQQQTYGYNQSYNQGYGNQNNWGQARVLIARIDQIRQQIRQLDRRGALSRQEAYRLDIEAQQLRNQVRQSAYNGIDQREQWQFQRQLQRLEQRVSRNANDRNGRYDNNRYNDGHYNDGRGTGFGGDNRLNDQRDRNDRDDD